MKIKEIIAAVCIMTSAAGMIGQSAMAPELLKQEELVTEAELSTEEETQEYEEESFEILPSKYQSMRGYDWEDLYVILMLLTKTSKLLEGGTPVFSLVSVDEHLDPLLIIGMIHPETDARYYKMYATDEENIYELLEIQEEIFWDKDKEAFYLAEEQAWLTYSPHVLLKEEAEEEPDNAVSLKHTSLFEESVVSETIYFYLQSLIPWAEEETEAEIETEEETEEGTEG